MRTETKISRVADATARAKAKADVGQPGKARSILKEARDLAAEARRELDDARRDLDAGLLAINAALAEMDARGR